MMFGNRKGFTLIELLIYMGIVGVIVVIAGEAFSNSTKFRVRTDNMIRATQEAENVGTLFREDVALMGAKLAVVENTTTSSPYQSTKFTDPTNPYIDNDDRQLYRSIYDNVYMDPESDSRDSSSFLLSTVGSYSDLRFRRLRYNDNGGYEAVEEIHWYVENKTLKRSCRTVLGTAGEGCLVEDRTNADGHSVTMATHVQRFLVNAAKPILWDTDSLIFPSFPWKPDEESEANMKNFRLIPREGSVSGSDILKYHKLYSANQVGKEMGPGTEISLSNFKINYDEENGEAITDNDSVDQVIAVNPAVNETGEESTNWQDLCRIWGGPKDKRLSLKKDAIYEISFEIPYQKPFGNLNLNLNLDVSPYVPGMDHMSIGFRDGVSGTKPKNSSGRYIVDDFMFFPPYNADGASMRKMRFALSEDVSQVCLALTFARYSPRRSGEQPLKIKNLQLKQIAGANYIFEEDYNPEEHDIDELVNEKLRFWGYNPENVNPVKGPVRQDKKFIRALRMRLQVSRGASNNQSGETGNVDIVVPIPSNGPVH